jgi:hypothetical protein
MRSLTHTPGPWKVDEYIGILTTTTYYKFLTADGRATHAHNFSWSLPKGKRPGKWMPKIKGDLVPCENGYHVCSERDLLEWCHETLYEVEVRGEIVTSENKLVVREARLLRKVNHWNERSARMFACDCAEKALELVKTPDPRSVGALEVSRRFADGKASKAELDAARAAAWAAGDAARAAAWAAAGDAARAAAWAAWAAAWAAAWDAARAAAWAAAWDAARDAAWAAAGDAARAAAWAAAGDAARAAAWAAAGDAARAAARKWQRERLMQYLRGQL